MSYIIQWTGISMTLEQYFHVINKQPVKEPTMLDVLKAYWYDLFRFEQPQETIKTVDEDVWEFAITTGAYVWDGKPVPAKFDHITGFTDEGTWIEVVEKILEKLGEHYGYDIKSQVYYAVDVPTNDAPLEGQGRKLNDGVLQQLLLAFPEVYERNAKFGETKNLFE
jgi:hypothetical protein